MASEKVIVRLTSATVEVLETLVKSGEFPNLSEVMLKAVEEFIARRFTVEEIAAVLEGSGLDDLDPDCFSDRDDDGSDLDSAVRTAVSAYVKERMDGKR